MKTTKIVLAVDGSDQAYFAARALLVFR